MAEHYNAHAIVVTDETVSIGSKPLMNEFLRAEPYHDQLGTCRHHLPLWLHLPIVAMIAFVQLGAIPAMRFGLDPP